MQQRPRAQCQNVRARGLLIVSESIGVIVYLFLAVLVDLWTVDTMERVSGSRAKRSEVWEFMDKYQEDGKAFALSRLCEQRGLCATRPTPRPTSGTTWRGNITSCSASRKALLAMKARHTWRSYFAPAKKMETLTPEQSARITVALVDWCALDLRPFSISQGRGFRKFMACVLPEYKIPSRPHLTTLMRKKHADGLKVIRGMLRDSNGASFTTNGWTSAAQQSYAAFTAYFLDKNWTMHSFVLETSEFPGSHTAEAIKTKCFDLSLSLSLSISLSLSHSLSISFSLYIYLSPPLSFFQPD